MTARCLILGFDGFSPDLATRWMTEGYLPNLTDLAKEGSFSPLRSTMPPVTIPAWTTMMTGVNPGRHGMMDFTRLVPGTYQIEFLNATHRRAPTLWRILSDAGARVAAVGFPASWPPEKINGVCISGFDSPVATTFDSRMIEPLNLYEELRKRPGLYRISVIDEVDPGCGWHAKALQPILNNLDQKARSFQWLLEREHWDCFAACFSESDTVSHHFWMFHDKKSPRHLRAESKLANAIRNVYIKLDIVLGSFRKAAGDDCKIFIVSDHGFGGASDRVVYINNWLQENGFLEKNNRYNWANAIRNAGLHLIPRKYQQQLFRMRSQRLTHSVESAARFNGLQWQFTQAYSEELNYFPSIRLNIAGRDPLGVLQPDSVPLFITDLKQQLLTWRNPETNLPFVANLWQNDEIYSGPHTGSAPDLLLELNVDNGYSYNVLSSPGRSMTTRKLSQTEIYGGRNRGMNGTHRSLGVLFSSFPLLLQSDPGLEDIAPTVLKTLGLSQVYDMEGRPLIAVQNAAGYG